MALHQKSGLPTVTFFIARSSSSEKANELFDKYRSTEDLRRGKQPVDLNIRSKLFEIKASKQMEP